MAQYNVKKLTFSSGDDSYSMSVADFIKTINGILPDEEGNLVIPLGTAASKSVANDLTVATSGVSVLDAYQGKILNEKFIPKTSIVDDLTTGGSASVLSAKQGVTLNSKITAVDNKVGTNVIGKVTSESTSSTYYYRAVQFPGGLLINFLRKKYTVDVKTAVGNMYKMESPLAAIAWKIAYSGVPAVAYSVQGSSGLWVGPTTAATKDNTGAIQIMSPVSASNKSIWLNVIGIGLK